MARVLLIEPPSPEFLLVKERHIPLSVLYLSAALKRGGHSVRYINAYNAQNEADSAGLAFDSDAFYAGRIEPETRDFKPDLIGITVHYAGRFHPAVHICRRLKETFPGVPIVMGGIHATIFTSEILKEYACIDFILKGESDHTMVELSQAVSGIGEYGSIDGLAGRNGGTLFINSKKTFIDDVDELPLPDYDLVDIQDYYFDTSAWHNPKQLPINLSLYLLSSRSCPRQCAFCSMYLVHGNRYRMRSAINVVDEIEYLYRRYNHRYFSFMDDNLTFNKKRIISICEEILRRGIDIQFDTPNGVEVGTLDQEVLDAMVEAGLVRTCLAVESGSEEIRRYIHKRLSQRKIYEIFDLLHTRYPQLAYNVFFIVGFPMETHKTLAATESLIRDLCLKRAVISFATPFPGTQLYEDCLAQGLITPIGLHNLNDLYFGAATPPIKPHLIDKQDLIDFRMQIYRTLDYRRQLDVLERSRVMTENYSASDRSCR